MPPARKLALSPPLELRLGLRHDDTLIEPESPRSGEPVTFSLWALAGAGITSVELRSATDGEEERTRLAAVEERGPLIRYSATLTPRTARFRYRFRLHREAGLLHYTMRGLETIDPVDAFDFTLLVGDPPPAWPLDAVLYQIFPDRFENGDPSLNVKDGEWSLFGVPARVRAWGEPPLPWSEGKNVDFTNGDLPGIEKRLDHLVRLGVNAVFLNPIWPARTNHRYDYFDHGNVDPHLGGDAALSSLAGALHARNMRLVLDVVFNHSGSAHPWFNRDGLFGSGGAYRDPDAPSRDFYFFDSWPDGYRAWMGIDTLPRLNLENEALRELLFAGPQAILRKFLRPPFSVDGYRFDVANMMGRDGALQHHRELWSAVRAALREERPDVHLLGEHFFDPDKLLKGDGLDGVMAYNAFTFPLRAFLAGTDRQGTALAVDAAAFVQHAKESFARAGFTAWRRSTMHVNTHDIARLQTFTGDARTLDVATTVQLAFPGLPCLYYGDEIGMEGGDDPDNRRCMEWDESKWDGARFDRTRELIALRRASTALRRGGFVDLGSAGDVIAFARILDEEVKIVVASRAKDAIAVTLDLGGLGRGRIEVELEAMSARILDGGDLPSSK